MGRGREGEREEEKAIKPKRGGTERMGLEERDGHISKKVPEEKT